MLRFITISLLVHGLAIGAWYLAQAAVQDIPVNRVVSLSLQMSPPASSTAALHSRPEPVSTEKLPERAAHLRPEANQSTIMRPDEAPDQTLAVLADAETANRDDSASPSDLPGNKRVGVAAPAEPAMDPTPDVNEVRDAVTRAIHASFRYPRKARRRGWEGTVILTLRVQADGHLTDIQVIGSSGIPLLDQDALATARTITLLPREQHSLLLTQAVEIILPVQYRLLEG